MDECIEIQNLYRLPSDLQNLIFEFYNPYKEYYSRYVLFQFKLIYIKCHACGFRYRSSVELHHNKFCSYRYINYEQKKSRIYEIPQPLTPTPLRIYRSL